ncbi:MAG: hypothetical protein ACTHW1_08330 [Ancrocorticia sp.]|uniref:hypothetical protein n=1 Tax=Ancrocorticia sp. TaxID=2593684 RepID=UPI003F8DD948
MAIDPRSALDSLIGALETFHQAALSAQDPDAPSVIEASDRLADAYTVYDDVMFTRYDVELPLDVYAEDDSDDEDSDDFGDFDDDDDSLDDDDLDDDGIADIDEDDLDNR